MNKVDLELVKMVLTHNDVETHLVAEEMTSMCTVEEWRDIPGIDGYQASSYGRIRNLKPRGDGYAREALSATVSKSGYRVVSLQGHTRTVHSLVCLAFHGTPSLGSEVAHGDGNKLNNKPDNLRWTSRKDNHADKIRHGTAQRGERHGRYKLSAEAVKEIRASDRTLNNYNQLASKYGVVPGTIQNIALGYSRPFDK